MPWHCEMGGQSKSIKRLDSGQGLGDPSPQGDPDNRQILLFKRWHVYKLFKPLSLFGHSKTQGLCLLHWVDLLPFLWECQLACFLFCFSTRVGQDVALHFDAELSWQFMYLCLFKPVKFQPNPAVKTRGIWQRKKSKLPHNELQMQWPGQTLKYQYPQTKHVFKCCYSVNQTIFYNSANSLSIQFKIKWFRPG